MLTQDVADGPGICEVEEHTKGEINKIIKELRNYISTGKNEELREQGGGDLEEKIHNLIGRVWKEELIPEQLSNAVICRSLRK